MDALTQNIERLAIIPFAAIVDVVTPNFELCGTPGHTNVDCQLFDGIPTD